MLFPLVRVGFESLALTLGPERHEEEPETDEAWMSFTASIPREIRLRRERAGKKALPRLELAELADALAQAVVYRLHLQAGFDEEMVVTAASMEPNSLSATPSAFPCGW